MAKRAYSLIGVFILIAFVAMGCQPKEITSAKVYKQQEDWDNVINQLESAVEQYPENAEAHFLLGEAYGMKKRWEAMNKEFDASLQISEAHQDDIKFYREKYWVDQFNESVMHFNNEDFDASIEALRIAQKLDPNRPEAYRNLAVTYMQLDSLDQAIESYNHALEIEPNHVETLTNKGITLYQMNKFEEAIETFKIVLDIEPLNEKAITTIAFCYDRLGRTDEAIASYEKALQSAPDSGDLMFNYARLFYQKGEYEKAIATMEKVLETSGEDYESLLSVGDSYLRIGENFRNDANKMDDNGGNESKINELRERSKESFEKAVLYLEKAVQIKDDNAAVWHNLGIAYINAGMPQEGNNAFQKSEALKQQAN